MSRPSPFDRYRVPLRAPRTPPTRWVGERDDPNHVEDANTRLDRIETDIRAVIDAGGEFALRNRLARVLPTAEAAQEKRLLSCCRIAAGTLGYSIQKSRTRRPHIDNQGGWRIIDSDRNAIIAGARWDLTLADVAAFLDIGEPVGSAPSAASAS